MNKQTEENETGGILKNNKGLTLVELIIALAISVIVVAAAGFILLTQSGVIRFNRSVSTEQQRLNTAFNVVRYSLRMAGFDYGNGYFATANSVPPVQVVQASYPNNPYEVLVSYSAVVNGSNPCVITPNANSNSNSASARFNLSASCNINNFYIGQIINIINPVPLGNQPLQSPPITFCVTNVLTGSNAIIVNPGIGNKPCGTNNPVPPKSIGGGNVSSINQILFYWGNTAYNFNAPFNVPGNLYECTVSPIVKEPPIAGFTYTPPTCSATIMLSDYINNFAVAPQGYSFNSPLLSYYITSTTPAGQIQVNYSNGTNQSEPPYFNLAITGESNVALSDSPAYSVNVPYNSNAGGANAKGNAGQIVGNNVLKTLNSSIFLRNIYYGS
ncbi:MAG: prepilin-type N-terminal cleavage/methylation domain-containing protein [Deltaproteobacteria bacterium]|jgi:prepilin-type N-terminal cleavage/methylation domain-containing protein|nr:prepilin-type N-terminal cleavage/methylation domain-containing protein [Deltaproteobacteria bacterium]